MNQSRYFRACLPHESNIIKRQGTNDSSKDFIVRCSKVQPALHWLKCDNSAYNDIIINERRLEMLPVDVEINDIHTVNYATSTLHANDQGPAPQQLDPGNPGNDEGYKF